MKTLFMQTLEFLISEIYQNQLTSTELQDSVDNLLGFFKLLFKIDQRIKDETNKRIDTMCNNVAQNIANQSVVSI